MIAAQLFKSRETDCNGLGWNDNCSSVYRCALRELMWICVFVLDNRFSISFCLQEAMSERMHTLGLSKQSSFISEWCAFFNLLSDLPFQAWFVIFYSLSTNQPEGEEILAHAGWEGELRFWTQLLRSCKMNSWVGPDG